MPTQPLIEELESIVKGIDVDEIESKDGWWETSTGVEFGTKKLAELKELVSKAYTKGTQDALERVEKEILGLESYTSTSDGKMFPTRIDKNSVIKILTSLKESLQAHSESNHG